MIIQKRLCRTAISGFTPRYLFITIQGREQRSVYLVVDAFNLIKKTFRPQGLHIVLFEVDSLVVEGLQVGLLVLLPPNLIETLLGLSPLFLLSFQPGEERKALKLTPKKNIHVVESILSPQCVCFFTC